MTIGARPDNDDAARPGDPVGVKLDSVIPWLRERCPWIEPPLIWDRIPGGHSNLTYRVADRTGNSFVFRRPPEGELLPSAHDMVREFTILRALFPSVVPVPEPLALCEDRSVTGSVFYAMRTVVGSSLYSAEESSALVPLEMRRDHGFHFIEVLADLHGIDPSAVGLGDLGRPDAYVARQLKRWKASWDASATTVLPDVGRLHEFLANNTPEQGPARVVHGDYGLHNCVSTAQGRIAAVIDWEISTLGDPLADLAYAINAWGEAGEESSRGVKPSLAPGYPTGNELLARYCARTRTEVSDIGFYRAFNHWKTACIIDGVLARYFNGQKSTEGVDLNALSAGRDEALARAVQAAIHLGYETT